MNPNQAPIIVGLDIGTTKIAAIAGRKNEYGKLDILGFGRANSNGVQHGQVLNIDQTIKAIQQALQNCAESNPDLEISEVYVGVAGHHIKSLMDQVETRGLKPQFRFLPYQPRELLSHSLSVPDVHWISL
ncbi:MAG: cell division protein FtsA, partial [Parafilimonas sp.]